MDVNLSILSNEKIVFFILYGKYTKYLCVVLLFYFRLSTIQQWLQLISVSDITIHGIAQ